LRSLLACGQFAAFVEHELRAVKATLASEVAAREDEDDAIEQSITGFTTKLQKSMHVINSIE
jgi:hypothetical protein